MLSMPLAARIAPRLRAPGAVCGVVSGVLAAADAYSWGVPHVLVKYAAIGVMVLAAALLAWGASDPDFRDAFFGMVAERQKTRRRLPWADLAFGFGLPVGDRVLFGLALAAAFESALLTKTHLAAGILSLGAFWLASMVNAGILVRAAELKADHQADASSPVDIVSPN